MRDVVRILSIFSFLFFLRYVVLVHEVLWLFIDIHCTFSLLYRWYMFFFHLPFHVLFLFFLYTHAFYYLYAIYYFCFTLRYLDEFCLKCFRNIGCQNLLAINSLVKFFKSLCYDRFYCIQQVSMSWVIYDFSYMFICLLWFCHKLPKGEIVRTYVIHLLGTYVNILCNWLIFWQKVLYL